MPYFLKERKPELTEWMDRPDCDKQLLFNTYRQFQKINRLISGWERIYRKDLYPVISRSKNPVTILDIGCGGGDILRILQNLCRSDNLEVNLTGIDPDPRAAEFLKQRTDGNDIRFLQTTSGELTQQNRSYDIVISNHLIHHLTREQLSTLCKDAEQLAGRLILFSDIERSDLGYLGFSALAPLLFSNSYIVPDGKISIKRSYRKGELQKELSSGWKVERRFPFRLVVAKNISRK